MDCSVSWLGYGRLYGRQEAADNTLGAAAMSRLLRRLRILVDNLVKPTGKDRKVRDTAQEDQQDTWHFGLLSYDARCRRESEEEEK